MLICALKILNIIFNFIAIIKLVEESKTISLHLVIYMSYLMSDESGCLISLEWIIQTPDLAR